ncbi:MAG: hypothetical protein ACFFCS_07040 [Candidatus Hodarchaeota archaeon]
METFSIDTIRAEKINDIYVIHDTGTPIYHRAYITSKVDDNLLSGFLTAIFTLSEEISTNRIQVMDMGETKFMYEQQSPYIFIINVSKKDVDEQFGKAILTEIIASFKGIINTCSLEVKSDTNLLGDHLESINFDDKLDNIVNDEILKHYLNDPKKILDKIAELLVGLFGSLGRDILDAAIADVSKKRSLFKKEHLKDVIDVTEVGVARRTGKNQARMIIQQVRDTFLS